MPECEICGDDVTNVYKCKNCGIQFCPDCGSVEEKLCVDCQEEDLEEEETE